jgi:hypothetical protein
MGPSGVRSDVHQPLHHERIGGVSRHGKYRPELCKFSRPFQELVLVPAVQHDGHPLAEQMACRGEPDSRGRTSDDGNLVAEIRRTLPGRDAITALGVSASPGIFLTR